MLRQILITAVMAMMVACTSNPKVARVDSGEVTDLSGAWNDTDSRLVAEEMIEDALNRPWYGRFESQHNKMPVVIVGKVRNLSHEHINVATFVNDMERALINSGRVSFVASSTERDQIRDERKDQEFNASEDTRKEMGREIGADFMLSGEINTIVDAIEGEQARYYQVDLKLISLADNRTVWIGQKKIKKLVKRSKLRY